MPVAPSAPAVAIAPAVAAARLIPVRGITRL
jgi:hypothetical protein